MRHATLLTIVVLLSAPACGGGSAAREGDDTRDGAIALSPGGLAMDAVSAERDDRDYIRFELPAAAFVTVRVDWDRPGIEAQVRVLDGHGKRLAQAAHKPGSPMDRIGGLDLDDGAYFIEIRATKGSSTYSVAVIPSRDLGADAVPRPE